MLILHLAGYIDYVSGAVTKEISDRTSADTFLSGKIDEHYDYFSGCVHYLSGELDAETDTRIEEDEKLSAALNTETDARTSADAYLSAAIDSEVGIRTSAIDYLSATIDDHYNYFSGKIDFLSGELDTETDMRIEGDNILGSAIEAEVYNRIESVENLQNQIDTKLDTTAFREVSSTFITSANDSLSGKYLVLKDNTWTAMPEIGGYTTANGTGDDNHPDVENPSTKLIYLVKNTESSGKDNYYEWIYSVDESHEPSLSSWDCIGDTSMDLSDYATIDYVNSSINTAVDDLSEQIDTKLDTTAFNPEKFYPMSGNPSGFLVEDNLSGYATKELLEDVANELEDEIDTKQRILSAGDYISIVSGEDADIISVTGLDTNTYFNATYNRRTSTDYFTFDGTKLSANSAIGYFNLTINYKVNTNNTIEDNYYSAGINVNNVEVDKHYIDGKIPSETYTFSKNVLNNAENNLYEIIKNTEPGVSISDLNITCIGFICEADAVNVGILGINGNLLTFGNTILRV